MTSEEFQEASDRFRLPLEDQEVEWRVQVCGHGRNGPWALLVPYIDARAGANRLDGCFGPASWKDEYRNIATAKSPALVCRVSIKIDGEWVGKEDGADFTDIEATKGGISSAFKRALTKWGLGRELYNLPTVWAQDVKTVQYKKEIPEGMVPITQAAKKDRQGNDVPPIVAFCPVPLLSKIRGGTE